MEQLPLFLDEAEALRRCHRAASRLESDMPRTRAARREPVRAYLAAYYDWVRVRRAGGLIDHGN